MQNPGFVYILINQAYGNLLKIGQTARDPEERARELSAATGVPSPFFVAYYESVFDCVAAERYVHATLEQKGYRSAGNREFFNAPLKEAILIVQEARAVFSDAGLADKTEAGANATFSESAETAWQEIYRAAELAYKGHEDQLPDYKQAMQLYKRAATLGAVVAFGNIGDMYRLGKGVRKNAETARDYYQKGANAKELKCIVRLASIYEEKGELSLENQCWDLLLRLLKQNRERPALNADNAEDCGDYLLSYFERCCTESIEVNYEFPFYEFRNDVISAFQRREELWQPLFAELRSTLSNAPFMFSTVKEEMDAIEKRLKKLKDFIDAVI